MTPSVSGASTVRVLAIVPARGGSKGVPRKNIKLLAGRPLLAYTADAARASGVCDRIVLSTDDTEIAAVGRDCGLEVPRLRPANLATDTTPMLPVLQHMLDTLGEEGWQPDIVVLLQPTSPLRRASHIRQAVELLRTARVQLMSRAMGDHVYHPAGPHAALRNALMSAKSQPQWLDTMEWLYGGNGLD